MTATLRDSRDMHNKLEHVALVGIRKKQNRFAIYIT